MFKILYICTHNRCRSILSEAITNHFGQGKILAKSAGSQPSGEVHPLSLRYLQANGFPIAGLQSQSWDEFETFAPDLVVTVCDSAAGETCPVWFGRSLKVHWQLNDPSKIEADEETVKNAFEQSIQIISQRVKKLMELDDLSNQASLKSALKALGAEF